MDVLSLAYKVEKLKNDVLIRILIRQYYFQKKNSLNNL